MFAASVVGEQSELSLAPGTLAVAAAGLAAAVAAWLAPGPSDVLPAAAVQWFTATAEPQPTPKATTRAGRPVT